MNLIDKHNDNMPVSEILLFESQVGITSAFLITEGILLKNQMHRVPALLICIEGNILFQDEKGENKILVSGDLMHIKPLIKYSLRGLKKSQILVIK